MFLKLPGKDFEKMRNLITPLATNIPKDAVVVAAAENARHTNQIFTPDTIFFTALSKTKSLLKKSTRTKAHIPGT